MAVNYKYIDGLSNSDILDDNFFYNTDAKVSPAKVSPAKVSPEMIEAGVAMTTGLISTIANRQRNTYKDEIKAACGRKPLLGKAKKAAYQKCVNDYLKTKASASAPKNSYTTPVMSEKSYISPNSSENKKFLGMPMGVGITATVLVVAAIGFGVYKLIIKNK